MKVLSVVRAALLACVAAAFLAACSGGGTYTRGLFSGYVMGKTEEEIIGKIGKPDSIDRNTPDKPRIIYFKKTFDPDNDNKLDEKVTIVMQKDASGKIVAVDLIFG
jgi:uncharacterized membrane protein